MRPTNGSCASSKTSYVNSTTKCAVNTKSSCASLRNDKGGSNSLGGIDGRARAQKGKAWSPAPNIKNFVGLRASVVGWHRINACPHIAPFSPGALQTSSLPVVPRPIGANRLRSDYNYCLPPVRIARYGRDAGCWVTALGTLPGTMVPDL